jgi:hypothetical protein
MASVGLFTAIGTCLKKVKGIFKKKKNSSKGAAGEQPGWRDFLLRGGKSRDIQ